MSTVHANEKDSKNNFNFIVGSCSVHNKRKNSQGTWMFLKEKILVTNFIFPNGFLLKGLTLRSFNKIKKIYYLVWLDNYAPPDFIPLIGSFINNTGEFYMDYILTDNNVVKIKLIWDNGSDTSARWRQQHSHDNGLSWNLNWEMIFYR